MNPATGEIKQFSEEEIRTGVNVAEGYTENLTAAEAETMMDVPPLVRAKIMLNWRDKAAQTRFANKAVKLQRKLDFIEGCVIGYMIANEK